MRVGCANATVLKAGSKESVPGSVFLNFPRGDTGPCGTKTSGPRFRCLVANGYAPAGLFAFVSASNGEMSGPFLEGLADRWNADSDRRESVCFDEYTGNGERVIVVPFVEDVPGRTYVQILGYGAFFLRHAPQARHDDLIGEFLYDVLPGTGGGGDSTAIVDGPVPDPGQRSIHDDPGLPDADPVPARPECGLFSPVATAAVESRGTPLFLAASASPVRSAVRLRIGLPEAATISLTIHDVAGRTIRQLASGAWPAWERGLVWDLRDDQGTRAPRGLDFVRLVTPLGERRTRVVLLP